jgi:hypothetical protein
LNNWPRFQSNKNSLDKTWNVPFRGVVQKHPYTNHSPRFSVHYYPQKQPEQVLYVSWEEHYLLHGYDLGETYETLKANVTDVIRQSQGPREVGKPYIEKIEFLLRP